MVRRDETPRDLLFGLLALQNGLIDQEQLLAAFGTWSRNKGKTLAEILIERGAIDAESRSILSAMAEKQLKLHGGDVERSLASVGAGPSTREKLAALGDTDLTASVAFVGSHTPAPDATPTMSIGSATSNGQRFRVLRPHAQGGLGAVFVALDGELNREVALKQILDHHADDQISRTRFMIEAEITGGLEHPGIVPVYGLGHYGDGRPYYAMRFIRGDSLKEAIAAFHADETLKRDPGKKSLALRKLLRRFVDICNAIDYAHGRGILHRDLKPGNIIVGKHGETLVVDWGLAKPMGHAEPGSATGERTLMPSSFSGSAETLPGSAIGTPAYMSPEQAAGNLERLGPRSDVYSLGATLYCLLTGKAPFEGKDLGAILREVQRGTFPPPRQVNPSIDRALEAVCLKAMSQEPEDRHATARALADDVERWAADEATSAWAEPFSVKARRWARRNRPLVTAASAAVLVAVVGLSAVLAVQRRANTALDGKNRDLDRANGDLRELNRQKDAANAALAEANGRVQARFELAREAIRAFQEGVTEDAMLKGEGLKGLRDKLLRTAASFYQKLETTLQGQTDLPSRSILAQSYFELGDLTEKIGIKPDALLVERKALAIRRELASRPEADAGARLDLARSLNAIGGLVGSIGDNTGALSSYEEARDLAGPLATGPGATDAARDVLGASHHGIGRTLPTLDRTAEALESFGKALAIRQDLVDRNPASAGFRGRLMDSLTSLANLQSRNGPTAEALELHRRALAIQEKLAEENLANADFFGLLADSHVSLGRLQSQSQLRPEALESYRKALAIRQKLADDNPAVTEFLFRLAESHRLIGSSLSLSNKAEALESHRKALAIRQKLAEGNPAVLEFRDHWVQSLYSVDALEFQVGNPAEALEFHRRAHEIYSRLIAANPADAEFRKGLAYNQNSLGHLLRSVKQPDLAMESYRWALAIREKLPENTASRLDLGYSHNNIGNLLAAMGHPAEALESHRRALTIRQKLADDEPASPFFISL